MAKRVLEDISLGDSIAINGACMTVAEIKSESFVVQVSPESYAKTTLGALKPGHAVNLERALRAGDRLGGHIVLGHVDGVGMVEGVKEEGGFSVWTFRAPDTVAKYLTPKGSVAIDGISLTVVEPQGDRFAVAIIPTTLRETVLSNRRPGDPVNMEADMIGKHIYHFMHQPGGVSKSFLKEHGYA